MQVIDCMSCKFACCLLISGDTGDSVFLQMLEEELGLLAVAVHIELQFEDINIFLLIPNETINAAFHPLEERVDYFRVLQLQGFSPLSEVSFALEFFPQLLAPFGEYPENGWTFDNEVFAPDFIFGVGNCIFGYLPSYQVIGVALHLLLVLLFVRICMHLLWNIISLRILFFRVQAVHPFLVVYTLEQLLHTILEVREVGHILVTVSTLT